MNPSPISEPIAIPAGLLTKRILITGASGFVGEHLTRFLAEGGCTSVLGTTYTRSIECPAAQFVTVDLRDPRAVLRLIRDYRPDVVFHCAAVTNTGFCEQEPESAHAGIVLVTENLVQGLAQYSLDCRAVALSTDLVFDGTRAPYREEDAVCPLGEYARLKAEAEALLLQSEGWKVIRPALIYGSPSTHGSSFLGWMVSTLVQGNPLGLFTDEFRTPVYVLDLVAAMCLFALHEGREKLLHVAGESRVSRWEMGEVVCREFDLPANLLVATTLEEKNLQHLRPADVSLNTRLLQQTLGLQPRSFQSGINAVHHALKQGH
ncbi:MAG: SDR family oxidoreductase [Candidatus Sumerlaeia bacterium]|nr:SDR family oxidoreductase [Candidatus Sumerlaeia bacterium]